MNKYYTPRNIAKKNTLRNIAKGKSEKDIVHELNRFGIKLIRVLVRYSDSFCDLDEEENLLNAARLLARLSKKIVCSGMNTALTAYEANLITASMDDAQKSGSHRLASLIRRERSEYDVKNILYVISHQIADLYTDSSIEDSCYWESGEDLSEVADYNRFVALKLRLLYDAIANNGIDTILSTSQFQFITNLLCSALEANRNNRHLAKIRCSGKIGA
jgi:hypothetical protein